MKTGGPWNPGPVLPADDPTPLPEELANPRFLRWYLRASVNFMIRRLECGDVEATRAGLVHLAGVVDDIGPEADRRHRAGG